MLETPRLILRSLSKNDKNDLLDLFGDGEVMSFSEDGEAKDKQWVSQWVDKAIVEYNKSGYEVMAVVERSTKKVLGYCGLFYYENIDDKSEVEIGYRLVRSSWGKGYATEAVQKMLDYSHGELGFNRIVAMIDPSNIASIKVAEKVGMIYEKNIMMSGYTHPDLLYVSVFNVN